jgi:hypothetical protein
LKEPLRPTTAFSLRRASVVAGSSRLKRSSEVRFSCAEVERRTAGEDLGGMPGVRIGSVEQQPP